MRRLVRIALNFAACTAILLFAAGGFAVLQSLKPDPEKREATEQVYNVQVFEAESVNLQEIVSAFGTVRADREVVVPAQVAGEITSLHEDLRVGLEISEVDSVVLARIDPRQYTERLERARSQLNELDADITRQETERDNNRKLLTKARSDLSTIQEQYERVQRNKSLGAASATDLTRALLEVRQYEQTILQLENESGLIPVRLEAARRKQESVRADLKLAELDVENTTVKPPFAGSVSEVMVETGQYVRVGDPLIRLTNSRLVEIPLPLALSDFLKIEKQLTAGQFPEVDLAVNETAVKEWTGRVVRAAPEADEGTRTAMVFVEVKNPPKTAAPPSGTEPPPQLRPGTFVHARISGPTLKNTIVIPRDAVSDGHVFVANPDGTARRVKVDPGPRPITLQSLIVIEKGLATGDRVVLTNLDVIRDGNKLSISDSIRLSDELARQRTAAARLLPSVSE